ncbi:hypothetical protein KI387_004115, partial [Taxus chinensis]
MEQQDKLKGQMIETHAGSLKANFQSKEGEATNGEQSSSSSTSIPDAPPAARNTTSKYDFVKVRVWLGDNADHYYVLSRFLLSRMLTVTKIPNHVAIKIALELKKLLVDNSLLDVSQSDLEANLFKLMERRGFGEEYINRYKMMTSLSSRCDTPRAPSTGMKYTRYGYGPDTCPKTARIWLGRSSRNYSFTAPLFYIRQTDSMRDYSIIEQFKRSNKRITTKIGARDHGAKLNPMMMFSSQAETDSFAFGFQNRNPYDVAEKALYWEEVLQSRPYRELLQYCLGPVK